MFKPTPSRICGLVAVLLAALHWTMGVTAVSTKSPTFDEPTHFAAGYSYWLRHDFRLDAESGNLSQRWATLPLLVTHPPFVPLDAKSWQTAAQGAVGSEFLYSVGNQPDRLLLSGRMMMALFGGAICLVVYFWSKELFGPAGGLISCALAAFCPTILAHGPLVNSDAALALFFSLSVWSLWHLFHHLSIGRFVVCVLSVAGVFLAKMSGALILLVIAIMFVIRISAGVPLHIQLPRCSVVRRRAAQTIILSGVLAVCGAFLAVAIWASYDWRYEAVTSSERYTYQLAEKWERLLPGNGAAESVIRFARNHHLLPEAYLYGLAYVRKNAESRAAFLDGNWSVIGFPDFFPRAFLYKTPLPVLCLILFSAGAVVLWLRRNADSPRLARQKMLEGFYRTTPLWTLVLVYGAFALLSRLNIGHRHILPIYPALFVACGSCIFYFRQRNLRPAAIGVLMLLAWQIGESVWIHPHYLAYFNQFAGGPGHGYTHLVDSSLDWGQDLPALKRWLENYPPGRAADRPVYLAYFGTAQPESYGINGLKLPEDPIAENAPVDALKGGLYCVSATTLQQVYSHAMGGWAESHERLYQAFRAERLRYERTATDPAARAKFLAKRSIGNWLAHIRLFQQLRFARLCAALRHRSPTAQAGYSIQIFDLSDEEVNQAIEGPPAELFPEIPVIAD